MVVVQAVHVHSATPEHCVKWPKVASLIPARTRVDVNRMVIIITVVRVHVVQPVQIVRSYVKFAVPQFTNRKAPFVIQWVWIISNMKIMNAVFG